MHIPRNANSYVMLTKQNYKGYGFTRDRFLARDWSVWLSTHIGWIILVFLSFVAVESRASFLFPPYEMRKTLFFIGYYEDSAKE